MLEESGPCRTSKLGGDGVRSGLKPHEVAVGAVLAASPARCDWGNVAAPNSPPNGIAPADAVPMSGDGGGPSPKDVDAAIVLRADGTGEEAETCWTSTP